MLILCADLQQDIHSCRLKIKHVGVAEKIAIVTGHQEVCAEIFLFMTSLGYNKCIRCNLATISTGQVTISSFVMPLHLSS